LTKPNFDGLVLYLLKKDFSDNPTGYIYLKIGLGLILNTKLAKYRPKGVEVNPILK